MTLGSSGIVSTGLGPTWKQDDIIFVSKRRGNVFNKSIFITKCVCQSETKSLRFCTVDWTNYCIWKHHIRFRVTWLTLFIYCLAFHRQNIKSINCRKNNFMDNGNNGWTVCIQNQNLNIFMIFDYSKIWLQIKRNRFFCCRLIFSFIYLLAHFLHMCDTGCPMQLLPTGINEATDYLQT